MKPLIRTFITNPVLVHMITIGVIVFGTFSFLTMPRELNPNLNFYWMIVEVWYPGVSPEEIEKLITKPIEDEISDVDNINTITSSSAEGRSIISIQFEQDISEREFKQSAQSLRTEIEKVYLPEDAEDPIVIELDSSDLESMLDVVVSGDLPEIKIKQIAEDLQEMIREIEKTYFRDENLVSSIFLKSWRIFTLIQKLFNPKNTKLRIVQIMHYFRTWLAPRLKK